MKVFLTGASGFVGSHVRDALVARGDQVRCLVRTTSPRTNLVTDDEWVEGDLTDADGVARAIDGCGAVYHCAADYRLYVPDPETMYASNVEGTRNVLRGAQLAGVDRVVYTSSVGALGLLADGSPADESTPVTIDDMVGHYKRSKYLAERVAQEWAERGVPVVIVSPSTPIGDRDVKPTATGRVILDFLNRQTPAFVDTGLNWVDVRDVAQGHLLAEQHGAPGECYILGNENLSLEAIFGKLATITGLAAPRVKLPHWIPLAVARVDTSWARLTGGEPRVPLDGVKLSRHKMYFDSTKAVRELGIPRTPVDDALRRAVDWFVEHGYVTRGPLADGR